MKSFIITGDQHLGKKLFNKRELEDDLLALFERSVELAIDTEVDMYISGGDLFDTNQPTSEYIDKVKCLVDRLKEKGILPLAICGDHSIGTNGVTWESICGFESPKDHDCGVIGFDYDITPRNVMDKLEKFPNKKGIHTIVAHGMCPQLWPFCDEKKLLDFETDFITEYTDLRQILLFDIHKPIEGVLSDPVWKKDVYIGYGGSLGVTSIDEQEKKGILYFDGDKLTRIKYDLPREFVVKTFDWYIKESHLDRYRGLENQPVFIVNHSNEQRKEFSRIAHVFDMGIVVRNYIPTAKNSEEINVRDSVKSNQRMEVVLKQHLPDRELFDVVYDLLKSDDPKSVLDRFKDKELKINE